MWIRSQDKKTLVKADYILELSKIIYAGSPVESENLTGNHAIGRYETEERALEVLDELQKHAIGIMMLNSPVVAGAMSITNIKPEGMIFQMPEK